MTKDNFWPDAARGGVIVGAIAVATACLKIWTPLGLAASLAELIAVAYCIYVFGKQRGEQTYGQCMKFVLAMMMLAGILYGIGYYFLVNHWAVDFFTQQFEVAGETVNKLIKADYDKQLVYRMMASPFYWVFYGVLAEVIYGAVVGLFVVAFIRKR